jgi:hypothetical protein
MKDVQPSRLALVLLRRLARMNEPLAGDLLEAFHAGRSRRWLWLQLIAALAIRPATTAFVAPPLGLAPPDWMPAPRRPIGDFAEAMAVNMSGSPVRGVGGLGLVTLGALVTAVQPAVWLLALPALAGGTLLGFAMVVRTWRRPARRPTITALDLHAVS